MKKYEKIIYVMLLLILVSCSTKVVSKEGQDFFVNHNLYHILGWLFFPRIMFWFFSVMTGGFFFWLGVLLAPRLMVAYWATSYYWDTNPILCVISWVYALCGEGAEKSSARGNR